MRDATQDALIKTLGKNADNSKETGDAFWRWHVNERFDIAVEKESPADEGRVWISHTSIASLPKFAEAVPAGVKRPEGLAHSMTPNLAEDKPVWKMTIIEKGQPGELTRLVKEIRASKGNELVVKKDN